MAQVGGVSDGGGDGAFGAVADVGVTGFDGPPALLVPTPLVAVTVKV